MSKSTAICIDCNRLKLSISKAVDDHSGDKDAHAGYFHVTVGAMKDAVDKIY